MPESVDPWEPQGTQINAECDLARKRLPLSPLLGKIGGIELLLTGTKPEGVTVKRAVIGGVAAAAVIVGGVTLASKMASPSLPDVQVPAIQLSSAEGNDATVPWLDLFAQTSADSADPYGGGYLLDPSAAAAPGESPLVLIDPETSAEDFDRILDGAVGNVGSQLNAVTSPSNGPDAVTYLILKNGS